MKPPMAAPLPLYFGSLAPPAPSMAPNKEPQPAPLEMKASPFGSGWTHSPNAKPPIPPPVAPRNVSVDHVETPHWPLLGPGFTPPVSCHCSPDTAMPSTPPRSRPVAIDEGTPRPSSSFASQMYVATGIAM